jgi:hypothetical protein
MANRGGRGGKEGFLIPEEVRQKVSKMRKSMKFSNSHRENLSKAFIGRTHTKEVRDKMSINRLTIRPSSMKTKFKKLKNTLRIVIKLSSN